MVKIQTLKLFIIFLLFGTTLLMGGCSDNPEGRESIHEPFFNGSPKVLKPLPMKTLSFVFDDQEFSIQIPQDDLVASKLESAPHTYQYFGSLPPNWRQEYYAQFLNESSENGLMTQVLDSLRDHAPVPSGDAFAEFVISFVQGSIQYDWETFHAIDQSQIRYPYQTLFAERGVCADKSILLARLLKELGYDIAFFTFERANHMALGIAVPNGYGSYGSRYAYVESTGYAPVGRVPETFAGGIRLDARPQLVKIDGGNGKAFEKIMTNRETENALTKQYGKEYLFLDGDQRKIRREMTELEGIIEDLRKQTRHCKGTLQRDKYEECQALIAKLNGNVEKYNALVADFNALADAKNNQFPI